MIALIFNLLIWLIVFGILYWVVNYVIDAIPIPDPFNRWIKIALVVFIAFACISLLLSLGGMDTGFNFPVFIK